MVPPCSDRISRVPPYSRTVRNPYPYGAFTLSGATFQNASGSFRTAAGLVRVRSPLLTESRLMSFPPVTEMFQFTGFASRGYSISPRDTAEAVGCPIRKFPAQSLLAAPRDLSQRATSFIASQCQGIPRMPFSRLSRGLHAQTSARARTPRSQPVEPHPPTPWLKGAAPAARHQTSSRCQTAAPPARGGAGLVLPEPDGRFPLAGANPRPGGGERDRTDDLLLAKQALSRLSYAPFFGRRAPGGPG